MESRSNTNYLWGLGLVALGVLFLVNQFFPFLTDLIWAAVLAVGGVVVFTVYQKDKERWWLLIPAYALVAVAGLIVLETIFPRAEDLSGAYVMFAIAAPFIYVYLRNNKNWWALIPGGMMAVIGLGLLINSLVTVLPALLIVAGIYLLVRNFSGSKAKSAPSAPRTGPEADKPK
jgi:uncharacterized membrane protein HdeD (DUF308 family)